MPFRDFDADRQEVSTLVARTGDVEVHLMTWQDLPEVEALRRTNQQWLAEWVVDDATRKNTGALSFAVKLEGQIVGELTLWNVDRKSATMPPTLGYWIDQSHARRGIMKVAVAETLAYAHRELALRRVLVPIAADNAASLALARSLGLLKFGEARYNGVHARHIVYAAERSDSADLQV